MSARKYGLVSLLLLAMAGNAWSQEKPVDGPQRTPEQVLAGTITSGAASWALTSAAWTSTSTGPLTNFLIGAQDQAFQDWWWYRLSTDTREFTFPTPTTETYVGNTATLSWTNLNGTGLNAQLVVVVADAPARTTQTMTISNPTAAAVNITVFRYADFDLNGTVGTDSAVINTSPTFMTVSDGPVSMPYHAAGAANYAVSTFATVRGLLSNAAVDNFANTGLPFAPGDFTGGFQWASRAVGPGASTSYESVFGAPPPQPAITLAKTVGTTAGACAATDAITVDLGTPVYYCFQATNTGNVPFTIHNLVDSHLGTLLTNSPVALAPGATTAPLIVPSTATATVTNTATWTAASAATYTVNTTAPFNYIPINATGTALGLADDGEANIVSPFPITYFGVTSTNLRVGNNGGILFNATTGDVSFTNAALPNAAAGLAIFPFWDDIDSDTGNVYWQVQGAAPNRQLIVEWFNRPHFSNTGSATFQVIFSEGTNEIRFQYLDVDFGNATFNNGASATVGLNVNGTTAQQVSFNTPTITNNQAILFTPPLSASAVDTATVTVLIPNINVTPASLSATAPVNQTTSTPLTIGNTGQGTLNWNLAEEPVGQPQSTPAGRGDAGSARDDFAGAVNKPSEPDTSAPMTSTWRRPEAVLFDNGPLITNPGAGAGGANVSALQLNNNTLGFGHQIAAGNRVADDFVVGGSGWLINTVTFFTYQTGSTTTSTINAVNVRIWNGPPNVAGSAVVFGDTTTNRLASSTYSGINRTSGAALTDATRPIMANVVTINTFLPAGTYWFDWQTGGTLASGPWAPPVTVTGQLTKPGSNGLQFTTAWAAAVDGVSAAPQDFPFIIDGLSDCANPSDVPWLSLGQTSGSNAAGTSTPVTVGFDATGLAVGNYQARLCATSNDPDLGPGNGTGLVIVPVSFDVTASADLVMTLTDAPDPVTAGNTLTYTATVTNTGPTAADNVSFSMPVPVGTTFVSATPSAGGACVNNGTVTCTYAGSTAVGASVSATIVVQVPASAANGSTITATATATSPTFDPNLANNVATATTGVITSADLQVALTASVNQTPINVPVTFTATSLNLGPSDAQNVSITVSLTPDFRYSSHSAPGATCTVPQVGTTGAIVCTWAGATAPGVTRTLTVVAFSNVEGPTAVNASTTSDTTDPVPGNNNASVTVTVGYLVEEIPTLGNLGLLLMGLMIALAGFVAVRRQA